MSRVAHTFVDALGTERSADPTTIAQFEAIVDAAPRRAIAATMVVRDDEPLAVDLVLPEADPPETLRWRLLREDGGEDGGEAPLRDAPVVATDTRRVMLGSTPPPGRHRLVLEIPERPPAAAALVVVPRRGIVPEDRTWGIAVQLYTLRSDRNVGIGDLADLRAFCRLAGDRGARYVGINPLHAGFRRDPEAASPYAAASRRWLSWLAIAVDDVPEAAAAAVRATLAERGEEIAALRAARFLDYSRVAAVKEALLRRCFAALAGARLDAFAAWRTEQGEPLARFAAWEVIVARHGVDPAGWPATLRDPRSPDVALLVAGEADEIGYAAYLQWCAAQQLAAVAADAAAHGVRLYRDLAVGVDANAADVWADAAAYVPGVTVGAPPDPLNPRGQDWGLRPLNPVRLADDGYAAFLDVVESNCRDAGALRIDHAMSLARLYWIPRGADARSGTYVEYPFDDLRGLVALAGVRNGCIVIGEDLGTVPPGFRETMAQTGILSYRVLFFERDADGRHLPPEAYPAPAIAASGTHDIATMPAWLHGDDLELRDRLGVLRRSLEEERSIRARDRAALLSALVARGGLDPARCDDETAVTIAANRYLAASPAAIVIAPLDDVLGEREPVNVPGTWSEYPNWRRRLATSLEAIGTDPRFAALCAALAEARPRGNSVPAGDTHK